MEQLSATDKLKDLDKKQDECSKGGKHEAEMRQGGLGHTYEACAKCGIGIPPSGHLGSH